MAPESFSMTKGVQDENVDVAFLERFERMMCKTGTL
jgi:hypothetical protein